MLRRPSARRQLAAGALAASVWLVSSGTARAADADADAGPALRLAVERDYAPFVFVEADGRPQGLSVEMLALLAERARLRLEPLPAQPLVELLAALRDGRADVVTSLRPTPERADYLLFTRPYVEVPAVLVVRDDAAGLPRGDAQDWLAALHGRPVAVGAAYAVEDVMRSRHPRVAWQAVPDDATALRGVAERRFDAAVADAASVAWLLRRLDHPPLRVVGSVGFQYPLSFGVRRDLPALRDRLDAALVELPAERRREVLERWLQPLRLPPAMPRWPAWVGGGALLLAAAVWGWRARGRRAPPEAADG